MRVKELIEALKKFPEEMPVKVLTEDGNAYVHEDPELKIIPKYIESPSDLDHYEYVEIDVTVVEIS